MQRAILSSAGSLRGAVEVPGDKSISHRALILASQAGGESRLFNLSRGEDVRHTAAVLKRLGVPMSSWPSEPFLVRGMGPGGWEEPDDLLDFGNSGTGIRLMAGMLAAHSFFSILTGDRSLRRRPMGRIVEPLRLMGAAVDGRRGGALPPLAVRGGRLQGITYRSPVASAQVKSSVLLAGLLAGGTTEIDEPSQSRDHTEIMLRAMGVDLEQSETSIRLRGGQEPAARDFDIPGDPSAAAFLVAAAIIIPNSEVTVHKVCVNPTRTGFFEILGEMGADISFANRRESRGEQVADITARSGSLRGIDIPAALVPRAIDEFPILAVLALFAEGTTRISQAAELRLKESDRIRTMSAELALLGGKIEETDDGMSVTGGSPLNSAACRSHGDHRVAMALAVAGCAIDGGLSIDNTDCVNTSFPDYWETLRTLGGRVETTVTKENP